LWLHQAALTAEEREFLELHIQRLIGWARNSYESARELETVRGLLNRLGQTMNEPIRAQAQPNCGAPLWRSDRPPNEEWVEVKDGETIVEAMAFYGRDGWQPHWRTKDGKQYLPTHFREWRAKPAPGALRRRLMQIDSVAHETT
jgi:hypothetical protein